GKSDVLGKTLRVNSTEFIIIGVMPPDFTGVNIGGVTLHSEFYAPRMMMRALSDPSVHPLTDRTFRHPQVYGPLKPGLSIEQARSELARIGGELGNENPATNRAESMTVYTQLGFLRALHPGMSIGAFLFLAVGTLVLVIGCVNVATLMLSRAPVRARESAVRLAMGAPATRLAGEVRLGDCSVSISGAGAGLGIRCRVWASLLRGP